MLSNQKKRPKYERNTKIYNDFINGMDSKELCKKYALTPERIRSILNSQKASHLEQK